MLRLASISWVAGSVLLWTSCCLKYARVFCRRHCYIAGLSLSLRLGSFCRRRCIVRWVVDCGMRVFCMHCCIVGLSFYWVDHWGKRMICRRRWSVRWVFHWGMRVFCRRRWSVRWVVDWGMSGFCRRRWSVRWVLHWGMRVFWKQCWIVGSRFSLRHEYAL
jgi:hypothetical protein